MKKLFLLLTFILICGLSHAETFIDGSDFSEYAHGSIKVGEVAGSATVSRFPSVKSKLVMFKAAKSNAGNVYIGVANVTKLEGTTDTTGGWELGAGESTSWIPVANLDVFYRICDNAGDDVVYMIVN